MNLGTQQDLNVIIAPITTLFTWVSNSPQIAAVDQNGMVTTFNKGGERKVAKLSMIVPFASVTVKL